MSTPLGRNPPIRPNTALFHEPDENPPAYAQCKLVVRRRYGQLGQVCELGTEKNKQQALTETHETLGESSWTGQM